MTAPSPEDLGRELADILAALKRRADNRTVHVSYVEVMSVDPPYFVGRFEDGSQRTILHGRIRPVVGKTWRVRQLLGVELGDDWAAVRDT